jgi:DNA polymerase-3 subunit delta'
MPNLTQNTYPWHESSWAKFVTAKSQNHLPHALLISGTDGTGKLDFAKKIATALLCTSPINNEACQNCKSCKTYQANANPDFMRIELLEGKQQIAVDQIRQLSDFINYTRSYDAHRVILLNPVERMNNNASNSLLKSLEEPANNTVIILVASNLSKIIPTIKSRCQILTLPSPTKMQALSWLKQNKEVSNPEEILEMANGQPLTALSISNEDIQSRADLANDLLAICTQQKSITDTAKIWEKFDHSALLNWQIIWSEKIIKNKMLQINQQVTPKDKFAVALTNLAKQISVDNHWNLYQQLIAQKQYIHTSVNSLLFIENMLLLWLQASQPNN